MLVINTLETKNIKPKGIIENLELKKSQGTGRFLRFLTISFGGKIHKNFFIEVNPSLTYHE